ncbi:MAG: PcfB family protein [Bulleidia sp.]|nr:PcfB family protein [Bulleidia sp.]
MYLENRSRIRAYSKDGFKHGKQTVKQLIKQGQGVTSIPFDDTRISDFGRQARKYGIDYAVVKDKSSEKPKYMIFFKAKDTDALTQIISDYTAQQLNRDRHPSLLKRLEQAKEITKKLPLKIHHREQEKAL